ncbi:hypothetical protein KRMM14A1259_46350 [Krasilnikovia sp. MM14-A1259]
MSTTTPFVAAACDTTLPEIPLTPPGVSTARRQPYRRSPCLSQAVRVTAQPAALIDCDLLHLPSVAATVEMDLWSPDTSAGAAVTTLQWAASGDGAIPTEHKTV